LVIIEIFDEEFLLRSVAREIFLLDWPLVNIVRGETSVWRELVLVEVLPMATSRFARG
jgi:hypothetical protein